MLSYLLIKIKWKNTFGSEQTLNLNTEHLLKCEDNGIWNWMEINGLSLKLILSNYLR